MDAGSGLLGLVAGSGSIWVEGMGRVLAGLAAETADRDGLVKSTESDFVWACHQLQILPRNQQLEKYANRYPIGSRFFRALSTL